MNNSSSQVDMVGFPKFSAKIETNFWGFTLPNSLSKFSTIFSAKAFKKFSSCSQPNFQLESFQIEEGRNILSTFYDPTGILTLDIPSRQCLPTILEKNSYEIRNGQDTIGTQMMKRGSAFFKALLSWSHHSFDLSEVSLSLFIALSHSSLQPQSSSLT